MARDARTFLGWNDSVLLEVARLLIERFSEKPGISLEKITVVLPGRRAGRTLLKHLTSFAAERDTALVKPTIITPGVLPELFYKPLKTLISSLESEVLWADIVRSEPLAPLVQGETGDTFSFAWSLGRQLSKLRTDLGATGRAIPVLVEELLANYIENEERWQVLLRLMRRFEERVEALNRCDLHSERPRALEGGGASFEKPLILACVLDLPPVTKKFLEHATNLHVWVPAPIELNEGFDSFGSVVPSFWKGRPIQVPETSLSYCRNASEQAQACARIVTEDGASFEQEQIVVAAPDKSVSPYIEKELTAAGFRVRDAEGVSRSKSGPVTVLLELSKFLERSKLQDLGTLLRHPDVARKFKAAGLEKEFGGELIPHLDQYQHDVLPVRLGEKVVSDGVSGECVAAVLKAMRVLASLPEKEVAALSSLVPNMRAFLEGIYSDISLRRSVSEEKIVLETLEALAEELEAIKNLPPELTPELKYSEALSFLAQRISDERIEPNTFEPAIEILGWLELVLDDRPVAVVTGCNEGFLPESVNSDPFLPNTVRRALGLADNESRYARDGAMLTSLLHGKKCLRLISGGYGPLGEIRPLSRLLLTEERTAAERILKFYKNTEQDERPEAEASATTSSVKLPPQPPQNTAGLVKSASVSDFSKYLKCPYRYYLECVLGLDVARDDSVELDALSFGNIGHAVLQRFAQDSKLAAERDGEKIKRALSGTLSEIIEERLGKTLLPAVYIQLEQLKYRLQLFGDWQARWVAQGWRVEKVEFPVMGKVSTPHGELKITGRIDRIDYNATLKRHAVFDYKFSDQPTDASRMHRTGSRWVSLQLPLYRKLLADSGACVDPVLAFLFLSGSENNFEESPLEWKDEQFADAQAILQTVAENITAGVFWPPAERVLPGDKFAWLCGVGTEEEEEGYASE